MKDAIAVADSAGAHRDLVSPPVEALEHEQTGGSELPRDRAQSASAIFQGGHVRDRVARCNDEVERAPERDAARVRGDEEGATPAAAPRGGEHLETHVEAHGRSRARELRRDPPETRSDFQNAPRTSLPRDATPETQMGSRDGFFLVEGKDLAIVVAGVGDLDEVFRRFFRRRRWSRVFQGLTAARE